MKTTIKVLYNNPPKPDKKTGSIKSEDGRIFQVWPDKLANFVVGKSYEIDYSERDWQGKKFHTVTHFQEVNGNGASTTPTPAQNGAPASANGNGRSLEVQARIERQHSQEMALRLFALFGPTATSVSDEAAQERLKRFTDHFQLDIANSPSAQNDEGIDL